MLRSRSVGLRLCGKSCYVSHADDIHNLLMDPSFEVQLQSKSLTSVLPLLHGLKRILEETDCNYGAVYETVAGPFALGSWETKFKDDGMPLLSLLGETPARSNPQKPASMPKRSVANLSRTIEQAWASQGSFQADELETIHTFIGRNGLHSPAIASYIIHIDILADASAHHALHWIGQSEFNRVPGWLSESLFKVSNVTESNAADKSKSSPRSSPGRQPRYICIEAYDVEANPDELAALLQNFRDDPRRGPGLGPKCKTRVYKLFGSVGTKEAVGRR